MTKCAENQREDMDRHIWSIVQSPVLSVGSEYKCVFFSYLLISLTKGYHKQMDRNLTFTDLLFSVYEDFLFIFQIHAEQFKTSGLGNEIGLYNWHAHSNEFPSSVACSTPAEEF